MPRNCNVITIIIIIIVDNLLNIFDYKQVNLK